MYSFIKDDTFEKCSILFKTKAGENFDHPSTICWIYRADRNIIEYFED